MAAEAAKLRNTASARRLAVGGKVMQAPITRQNVVAGTRAAYKGNASNLRAGSGET
jgi:hypothetical protein